MQHAPRRLDPSRAAERQQPPALLGIQPVPRIELEAGAERHAVGGHESGFLLPGDILDGDEGGLMPGGARGRHEVGDLGDLIRPFMLGGEVNEARQAKRRPAHDERIVDGIPLVAAGPRGRTRRRLLEPGQLHHGGLEQRGGRLGVEFEQLDRAIRGETEIEAAVERRLLRPVRGFDQRGQAVGEAEGAVVATPDDAVHRRGDHAIDLARGAFEGVYRLRRQGVAGVARPVFTLVRRVEAEA